jgi:hypothetical protein
MHCGQQSHKRGSGRFRLSLSDLLSAAGHSIVLSLSLIPVCFRAAEEKALPTIFAAGLTAGAAFAARTVANFLSDTRA